MAAVAAVVLAPAVGAHAASGSKRVPGGNGSADSWSGSLDNMFSFGSPSSKRLMLNPNTGEPIRSSR
jgi:hypothetical protein